MCDILLNKETSFLHRHERDVSFKTPWSLAPVLQTRRTPSFDFPISEPRVNIATPPNILPFLAFAGCSSERFVIPNFVCNSRSRKIWSTVNCDANDFIYFFWELLITIGIRFNLWKFITVDVRHRVLHPFKSQKNHFHVTCVIAALDPKDG